MRSHYCGEVTTTSISKTVTVCGWVHRRRDLGGVIFIDLRDRAGHVQVVFEPENEKIFAQAEQVRSEYVLQIEGQVRKRPEGMINENLASGEIEIVASALTVLNTAETTPFPIGDYHPVGEDVRLRYRYLDMRRPELQQRLIFRAKLTHRFRETLEKAGFLDIETPYLTKSTPEGARDYLVPSRVQPGHFFALPQSPQLFKQLLMMSGFDRYYQVVRCFRDEDLRADRQPEFTQLDLEMSFVDENEIQDMMETMMRDAFKDLLSIDLPNPFPKITYDEAMQKYGNDRPDLRNPLTLVDVADLVKDVDFKVFAEPANSAEGRVACLRVPGGNALSRKQIDDYGTFVGKYGAKGLAYIKVNDVSAGREGLQSPIVKFLPDDVLTKLIERTEAVDGDLIFFGAASKRVVNDALGALRIQLGKDLDLLEGEWAPLWVVDFPMFERDPKTNRWISLHHPFTAPNIDDIDALRAAPGDIKSRAYDMVLNGTELGGGSIRIHNTDMQQAVFDLLGITPEEAEQKFGFLLNALRYGCPPHGGIAFGLDRVAMLMLGAKSIRDVIAFPKTQNASCLMTEAPSKVDVDQLAELHIGLMTEAE